MLTCDFDITSVEDGFRKIAARGRNLRPVLQEIGDDLRQEIRSHFDAQSGPDGHWPSWAASTQQKFLGQKAKQRKFGPLTAKEAARARRLRKHVTLSGQLKKGAARRLSRMLGRLSSQNRLRVEQAAVEERNIVPWSAVHDEGGTVGHGSHVPARQFMWASEMFHARTTARIVNHLLRDW